MIQFRLQFIDVCTVARPFILETVPCLYLETSLCTLILMKELEIINYMNMLKFFLGTEIMYQKYFYVMNSKHLEGRHIFTSFAMKIVTFFHTDT